MPEKQLPDVILHFCRVLGRLPGATAGRVEVRGAGGDIDRLAIGVDGWFLFPVTRIPAALLVPELATEARVVVLGQLPELIERAAFETALTRLWPAEQALQVRGAGRGPQLRGVSGVSAPMRSRRRGTFTPT